MYSSDELKNFGKVYDSLKKFSRSEIFDDKRKSILEKLYVDLLPNNFVLNKCLNDQITFLIGRKGTGKSTVFLRMQEEIRKSDNKISAYVDTRYIYEPLAAQKNMSYENVNCSVEQVNEYLLHRRLIKSIILEIIDEIKKKIEGSLRERIIKAFGISKLDDLAEELEELYNEVNQNNFEEIEIPQLLQKSILRDNVSEKSESLTGEVSGSISPVGPSIKAGVVGQESRKTSESDQSEYSTAFLQLFKMDQIVKRFSNLMEEYSFDLVYVILDDYSEIDDKAIELITDVVIAPFARWSQNRIVFKIAAYPNRYHIGNLDPQKVDKQDLDYYNLYSSINRDEMETMSLDFTKRILEKRFGYYCGSKPDVYFSQTTPMEEYYKLLFQASMNMPRSLGYILEHCFRTNVNSGKRITLESIREASAYYYNNIVSDYLKRATKTKMAKEEKISRMQLKELLSQIVGKQHDNAKRIVTGDLSASIYNRRQPYVSHFHVYPEYEKFLKSLEMNLFITKYNEMRDKKVKSKSQTVSIYALHHGLCMEERLNWGKEETNKHRTYFIESPFNFSTLIRDFVSGATELVCDNPKCNEQFEEEDKKFLERYNFECPECRVGKVTERSISMVFQDEVDDLEETVVLEALQYNILLELSIADENLRPKELAEILDCHYQMLNWPNRFLRESGYIKRRYINDMPYYTITDDGKRFIKG